VVRAWPFRHRWTVTASLKNTWLGCRTSEVHRAVSDPSHCVPVTTHAAAFSTRCNLSVTVLGAHQQEECCSSQFVNSQRCRRVWPTSWSPMTAGYVGVDKVGSSSPHSCEGHGDPNSDHKRYRRQVDEHGCRQQLCPLQAGVLKTCHSVWHRCDLSWQTAVVSCCR